MYNFQLQNVSHDWNLSSKKKEKNTKREALSL